MKRKLFLTALLISSLCFFVADFSFAQTDFINEGFESGLGQFVSSGGTQWKTDTTLFYSGSKSIRNPYANNTTNYLTLKDSVDLSTYTIAQLDFYHIAKVEISDSAYLQISSDGGSTWTTLDTSYYTGNGFLFNGKNFSDGSYTNWDYNNFTTPDNTWWHHETFNISSFTGAGMNKVKIRFKLKADPNLNWYGWVIDDVKITASFTGEFDSPVIIHAPQQNTGSTNPVPITAAITDATGVSSAQVYYRINGGSWVGPNAMTNIGGNNYSYSIPGQVQGTDIDYYIKAVDATTFQNTAYHPTTAPTNFHSFTIVQAIISYPFTETFETSSPTVNQWTHKSDITTGNSGTFPVDDWEIGTPSKTFMNGAHNGTQAYVTQLFWYYNPGSRSALISPRFDFSVIDTPVLSFYHKYDTDWGDGCRIDYSIDDGTTWAVLGNVGDPKGTNWYNNFSISSASNPNPRPGWNGYSNSWVQSSYNLQSIAGPGVLVRFRFAFTSEDFMNTGEGWEIDDLNISEPPVGINDEIQMTDFSLGEIFPNPSSDKIFISYSLNKPADVTIKIFNSLGQNIFSLSKNHQPRALGGKYREEIDLSKAPSGIYQCVITANGKIENRKIILIR